MQRKRERRDRSTPNRQLVSNQRPVVEQDLSNDLDEKGAPRSFLGRLRRLPRALRIRWSLLSRRARTACVMLLSIVLLYIILQTIDLLVQRTRNDPVVSHESEFAIVINTYKRPRQLREAVEHYADQCGRRAGIGTVYVVWAEQDVAPPDTESFFRSTNNKNLKGSAAVIGSSGRSDVRILQRPNSLNSRFRPIPGLSTSAVFMVDDDVIVDCTSVRRGFRAWKSHPRSMVGYYPRLAAPARQDIMRLIEHCWPIVYLKQQFNFVLTKACFLHTRYMKMYFDDAMHPPEIRKYVDTYRNCEDVAMSLLVANMTKAESRRNTAVQPIFVEGKSMDKGLFNGISTGGGFVDRRASCLTDLTAIYHRHGWGAPLSDTFDLQEASWVQHISRWQMRPSNPFEWGALLDFFK